MNLTDSIGDMLTRIRNALKADMESVDIGVSKTKVEIARILKDEGYISKFETLTKMGKKILRITLKYGADKRKAIKMIKRISTPGRRIYVNYKKIPMVQSGFCTVILSTNKGIVTDKQARALHVGGEVLCYVW